LSLKSLVVSLDTSIGTSGCYDLRVAVGRLIFFKLSVVGKNITTNPGYFSSGRFLNGEGFKRLLFSQLGSLVKD
jgi:hypothetical protein